MDESDRAVPLSSAQRRLWLAHQLAPANLAYNSSFAFRLTGPLDVGALERAVAFVLDRHDALRTRFAVEDGVPYQVIGARGGRLRIVEVTDPDETPWHVLADEPFDLATDELVRVALFRTGADEHVLLVCVHHIVFDGWSQAIFTRDLSAAYAALSAGQDPGLPRPSRGYADYARDEAAELAGDGMAARLGYWRQRLAGAPETLDLMVCPPGAGAAASGAISFIIPAEVTDPLRAVARQHGATLYMAALAGYAALLSRYAGVSEVVIGAPSAGRTKVAWEEVIGFFVNSLPLRIDLSADPSFSSLMRQVRDTVLAALTHDVPFDRLVEELAPARDPGRNAIFQAWCDMFPADPPLRFGSLRAEPTDAGARVTPFDIALHLTDEGDQVAGRLLFNPALFEPETMRRLIGQYTRLLGWACGEPGARMSRAVVLSPAERDWLLATGRGPQLPPPDRSLAELVKAQAAATPTAVAVSCGDRRVSYAELEARAAALAAVLRARGARPDTVIGLCLPRGVDQVVAVLAVAKSGAGYLPIDPRFPPERIEFMVADARPVLVLTETCLAERLPAFAPLLRLDEELIPPDTAGDSAPGLDHLAYLIYTSGSTGRPKAVAMPQRPLLNLLRWQLGRTQVPGPTAQFSSISFDASFLELFSTWACGAELVLIDEMDRRDPERLLDVLTRAGARRLFCPPPVLEQLARAAAARPELPPLSEFAPAGEQLRILPQVRALLRRLGAPAVDNQYGPSETHVVTAHRMTGDPGDWPELPPIGQPVDNCEVYLLDRFGQLVPPGVAGEIYLAGPLAWGYFGRPGLTAERFVPHPFAAEGGQRLYRTGDLGRWRTDGTLDFLGRIDRQLKIRGFRVEPGEVEAALTSHPSVIEAVVVPWQVGDDRRLAGYVVAADGAECDTGELDRHLRARLPDHLVPSYLVSVPRLPLTTVGKLDRDALPDPVSSVASRAGTRPRAGMEALIAGIWAAVLGLPSVGADQNFFTLGGHSLLAAQAVARLRQSLDADVPLALLFANPTVSALAAALRDTAAPDAIAVAGSGDGTVSAAQRGMWFLDRLDADGGAYNLPMAYLLSGPLDTDRLDRALARLLERHDVLRARFELDSGGEPHQLDCRAADLDFIDVSTAADPQRVANEQLAAAVRTAFDLVAGPPFRALLVRLGADSHVLAIVVHHIVFDGWSRQVLERELGIAYGQPEAALPALPFTYREFAAWQRAQWPDDRVEEEAGYWREALAGAPPLLAGLGPAGDSDGGLVRFDVDAGVLRGLSRLASSRATTLFTVTLAVFAAALSRCAAVSEVVIGTPVAGRSVPGAENVIGLFTNSVPLRLRGLTGAAVAELTDQVRDVVADALAHADLPFWLLVERLAPPRHRNRNPVFQVMFSLSDETADGHLDLPGLTCSAYDLGLSSTRLDLEMTVRITGERLEGRLTYAPNLFDPSVMRQLAADYATALTTAAAPSSAPPSAPGTSAHAAPPWSGS